MNRQNKRSQNRENRDDLSRWDFVNCADEEDSYKFPNIFSFLSNNLNNYSLSNRNSHNPHALKNSTQEKQHVKNRKKQIGFSVGIVKSVTANVFQLLNKDKNNLTELEKARKRLATQQQQSQRSNLQNVPSNLKFKLGKTVQNSELHVKNVKFDKMAPGYVKKKDRYRQIFGEKPKFVYVKYEERDTSIKNKKNSTSLVRLR